ncbi:probable RNA-binding protein EIF1AD [Penaeus japonicus]|uniref:probable RNA-binding protein EIF1AD n=1 Tax=Penaeus japonicus TaxID=27405 RepID=UPI001C7107B0|nr:probable RNA-binding protein EIF1AD [Penaeus japonicus]XP_042885183.1 probable RNA-binding protein EIF1AD [Penaeus japonicus]
MSITSKRKYVERELYDYFLPEEHQSIVKIIKPHGNNLHQVVTADCKELIASMPTKFRKHVWVKRGDYVVTEPIPEGNKVQAEIVRILMKENIEYLIQKGVWPSGFSEQEDKATGRSKDLEKELSDVESDNSEDNNYDTDFLMKNPNRPIVYIEETESSEAETSETEETE